MSKLERFTALSTILSLQEPVGPSVPTARLARNGVPEPPSKRRFATFFRLLLIRSILTCIFYNCSKVWRPLTGYFGAGRCTKRELMAKAMRDNGKAIQRLREVGLRPTRQRVELASVLFKGQDRHVTAESLYEEASGLGLRISLATVYNTLHQFTHAGLLRQVIVDAARGYFDTNTGDHQHFFLEDEGALIDIPGDQITVAGVPLPPDGLAVDRVDVVVRVKRA